MAEQETILRWDRESDDLTLETFSGAAVKRLLRHGAAVKREWSRGGQKAWTLTMPKRWFRWPRKPSEARSRAARERRNAAVQPKNPEATA